jgi:hypothetical protein
MNIVELTNELMFHVVHVYWFVISFAGRVRMHCTVPLFLTCKIARDDNSGTGTRYPLGTRPDGYGHPYPTWTETGMGWVFFPPVGNPMGTRYFTTAIILGCEQVKMCLFCYINYDLFWLLNFATRLSQIFVEY